MQNILLFDLVATQPNISGKRHGGGRYGEIILSRIAERNLPLICFYDSRKWLNPDTKKIIEDKGYPLYDIATQSLDQIVVASQAKRLYSALPNKSMLHLSDIELVGTIHGLRELETPRDSYYWKYKNSTRDRVRFLLSWLLPSWWKNRMRNNFLRIINSGMKIITVSNHSRASITSFFPELQSIPQVFFSPNTSSANPVAKDVSTSKYFMMVSGNRWEKNNLRAIMAFDRLVSMGKLDGITAVITGCSTANFRYKLHNPDRFRFYGYVEDSVLEKLYANAYAFVYPSLNEGFGYPPLEAMRYGVPVIASPFSSISEVLGGAALYFNPLSVEEIMSRMLLIMDPARHNQLSQLGAQKYAEIKARQDSDLDALIDSLYS
jgi:glycosyltransferase involved in cell wall biosynthesis